MGKAGRLFCGVPTWCRASGLFCHGRVSKAACYSFVACQSAAKVTDWVGGCSVYDLYADYVLKNPFYEVDMPIRVELFDQNLLQVITAIHRRFGLVQ